MIRALLTIDDVSSENTPAIVDYLCEKEIPAILFMIGKKAETYPQQLIYALRHGLTVGNHSYSHPQFSRLSYEECVGEIERNEKLLDSFYEEAGVERKHRPFRFPFADKGGANRERLQEYLAQRGFHKVKDTTIRYPWWKERGWDRDIDTLWTFDFGEYNIRPGSGYTMEEIMRRIYRPEPGKEIRLLRDESDHILLLHASDKTEELVPGYYRTLLGEMLKNGVKFVEPEYMP